MRFGVLMFPTEYAIGVVELGRAVEGLGFESLWLPEHTHIPASQRSPWPGGAEMPREYKYPLDPFVGLAAVASVTTTLKLGTGVCLVVEHDPIALAKTVASLDVVSGGRFIFGVGGGWNEEEMRNHGTEPAQRWGIMRERIEAMRAIWTRDEAEYHGRYVNFDPLWSWPKPLQKPHPPIYFGGNGSGTLRRVVAQGDGWMPIHGRPGYAPIEARIPELRQLAAAAGRGRLEVSIFGIPPEAAAIERYAELGVDRGMFWLPSIPREEALPRLTELAELARRYG